MRVWLKEIREKDNLSQGEMADKLRLPTTTYASYEQGKRTPTVNSAKRIADTLKINWTIFFDC